MPNPGWIPPTTNYEDDCFRLSLACATGLSLESLPHIAPDELTDLTPSQIDAIWVAIMKVLGWKLGLSEAVDKPGMHFWLACVTDSTRLNLHMVVMLGRDLWYDPEQKRSIRPRKFYEKWHIGRDES